MLKYVKRRRTVAILQGDDLDRLADIQRKMTIAAVQAATSERRMGDDDEADALREEYEQAKAEAAERAIPFDISPASRTAFHALLLAMPPRPDNKDDEQSGFNTNTFPAALVALSRPEDDEDTVEQRETFLLELPAGELDRLFEVAWALNTGAAPDPKDLPSLPPSPSSTEI